jgi:hypothetical protein
VKSKKIAAIDIVVNIWTKEANALRPKRDAFYKGAAIPSSGSTGMSATIA